MKHWTKKNSFLRIFAITLGSLMAASCDNANPTASLIITDSILYTANSKQEFAEAIAISDDTILYVGNNDDAKKYAGKSTRIINANGQMVLPGLHDAHIHPLGLVSTASCDLESGPLTLAELTDVITGCLDDAKLAHGDWLTVEQWNFTKGNQPDSELPNIRTALDKASKTTPIFLRGNDGHHGAANSPALASAKNIKGEIIGLNAETIAKDFQEYQQYIGVDKHGEPDGQLSEGARYLLDLPSTALTGDGSPEQLSANLPAITAILAKAGITSIQDAAADIATIDVLEAYSKSGQQTYRYTGALFTDFAKYSRPIQTPSAWTQQNSISEVDIPAIVADFIAIRDRQKQTDIFKVNAAKIFVDGVIEGNPFASPPSLPNAAVNKPYLQPIFEVEGESLALKGYVDVNSTTCKQAHEAPPTDSLEKASFLATNGFQPEQCAISQGRLEHERRFIHTYISKLESAGFSVHAHAIGDRAVATAIDAFNASKEATKHKLPQTISHAQQIATVDLERFKENPIYLAFTFAWAVPDYGYDVTVTPFIDKLSSLDDIYNSSNYAMTNHYPVQSAKSNGAIIIAGSDAPVDTRDPRPFINLAAAITRNSEGRSYNENERLSLVDALDAFTINSATAMQQAAITGSLEAGKKADLILIDRNLIPSAAAFDSDTIANTQVKLTVFNGQVVYEQQ